MKFGQLLFFLGVSILGFAEDDVPSYQQDWKKLVAAIEKTLKLQPSASDEEKTAEASYELGRSYYLQHDWKQAILVFEKILELQPNNVDAKLLLAYSYHFEHHSKEELLKSKELFEEVLKEVPDYADAKEGLEKVLKELQEGLLKAKPDEKNQEAPGVPKEETELLELEGLEKVLKELQEGLLKTKPDEKNQEAPGVPKEETELLELAKRLREDQNHFGAIEVYLRLIKLSPKNAEYMFFLGREYILAGQECLGIEALYASIEIKQDYSDSYLWLGKQARLHEDYCKAKEYFETVIELNPKDVGGWVGLALVESWFHNPCDAEDLFETAFEIEPENVDVVKPYADFLYNERRYGDSEEVFRYLSDLEGNLGTYRPVIFDLSSYTAPTVSLRSGAAEEREKDLFSHRWVASLRYLFYDGGIIYPFDECFRMTVRAGKLDVRQRLLVSHCNQFDVRSVWGGIKGEWFIDPFWTVVAGANMEWISNNDKCVQLPAKRGTKFEPTLIFRYSKDGDTVSFGEVTDSWIFRDFDKKHLRVVLREAAFVAYQHDFGDYRYVGLDAAWLWYQDPVHNQEQDLSGWLQCGIPYFEDILYARYQCIFRRFNHDISGYYSFRYELTHWLRLRLLKKWLSGAHVEAEYWHGWRTTKGRNPQQQLVVVPNIQAFPIVTVGNQIDLLFLTLGYMPTDYCDMSLVGSYYHDSFDYTTYGVKLMLDWRF